MANSIAKVSRFVPLLDEVYKNAALTSVLDGPNELVQAGANAGEIVVPKLSMQGLVNYNKSSGYTLGDVTYQLETYTCAYDRGRMFVVDNVDNAESAGIAFGRLAGEFIRTQVAPEIDAYRIAQYCSKTGVTAATAAALATGADVVSALRACANNMDENEVPATERYLFITPTLHALVDDLDTTKSRAVLARFQRIIDVPQSRMYTKLSLATSGAGGYSKGSGGLNLNFLCVHKPAAIQFNKHVKPKIITPEQNQDADAWKFGYRVVGITDVYDNKLKGIYYHAAPAA